MEISHLVTQANRGLDIGLSNHSLRALIGYIKDMENTIEKTKSYLTAASDGSMSRNNRENLASELLETINKVRSSNG